MAKLPLLKSSNSNRLFTVIKSMDIQQSKGFTIINEWMNAQQRTPFTYQIECWQQYADGANGLVNAPTGFGKTFSVFLAVVIDYLNHPECFVQGTQLLWITPLRSLAKDLARAMSTALDELNIPWRVGVRNGDTEQSEKLKQKKQMPEVLIITPESLHLLIAQKGNSSLLQTVKCVAVDEWHELLGNKRGVLTELALTHLRSLQPNIKTWGISATIGNLEQACDVLIPGDKKIIIRSLQQKKIEVVPILPQDLETLPWAGHMGLKMAQQVVDVIAQNKTTLIFTNTRNQAESWYQTLLKTSPDLAGQIALHHGSIDFGLRQWIEDALHQGILKAVVCTSSLDLGVDFKPVDAVVQVGSPKGVARFLQRAGRSGHSPFELSKIYFLPTHSLELVECAALKEAIEKLIIEPRIPMILCFDVLVQYLITLAVGEGLHEEKAYAEIKATHAFAAISQEEWQWVLSFIITGGEGLQAYDDFQRVVWQDGLWKVKNRTIAMRHRLQIGAIVSEAMLQVRKMGGGYLGMVEEYFASRLLPGACFVFAGSVWEFITLKEMQVIVKPGKSKTARAPSWNGGRLPLSANLSSVLRAQFDLFFTQHHEPALKKLDPLIALQQHLSAVPASNDLLVEVMDTKEGQHLFIYPFEGRLVHEVMAALVAYRISKMQPISFSMAMNDYGFELLSYTSFEVTEALIRAALSPKNILQDLQGSINASEMARRKFRDVATIAGLLFTGYPGKFKTNKNLQSTAGILFQVFEQHDPANLLMKQAYEEVYIQQLEDARMMEAFQRFEKNRLIITHPPAFTPLSFPIKVDSLRDTLSSEKLEDRIRRMRDEVTAQTEKQQP